MRKPLFLIGDDMNLYPDMRATVNDCMPATIYALEGRELNIYWDTILSTPFNIYDIPAEYRFDVVCTKGIQELNRWTYTPTSADAGITTWVLNIYYNDILIKKVSASLKTTALATGSGTCKLMVIGDSTTSAAFHLAELVTLFTGDAVTLTLTGALRGDQYDSAGAVKTTYHEGRAGWGLNDYVNTNGIFTDSPTHAGQTSGWSFDNFVRLDMSATGLIYWKLSNSSTTRTIDLYKDAARTIKVASGSRTGNGVINFTPESTYSITGSVTVTYTNDVNDGTYWLNPFFRSNVLNYTKYMSDNSLSLSTGDWVYIHLGINEILTVTDSVVLNTTLTTYINNLDTLIANIKAYSTDVNIGILQIIPPNSSQDAFGYVYSNGQTQAKYSNNRFQLCSAIKNSITSKAVSKVYYLPYGIGLDSVNNFPEVIGTPNARNVSSIMKPSNAVHPSDIGYYQLADVIAANIKGFE